jgi:ABC-type sulfate transport system permease subunit
VSDPSVPESQPTVSGRVVALGIVLGLVLVPLAVFGVMAIVNRMFFECSGGGAEDSLSCALRQVVITVISIPFGVPIGIFMTHGIWKRRMRAQAVK